MSYTTVKYTYIAFLYEDAAVQYFNRLCNNYMPKLDNYMCSADLLTDEEYFAATFKSGQVRLYNTSIDYTVQYM